VTAGYGYAEEMITKCCLLCDRITLVRLAVKKFNCPAAPGVRAAADGLTVTAI
jgi:hypothetical protein